MNTSQRHNIAKMEIQRIFFQRNKINSDMPALVRDIGFKQVKRVREVRDCDSSMTTMRLS